jgi:hypothetical protein
METLTQLGILDWMESLERNVSNGHFKILASNGDQSQVSCHQPWLVALLLKHQL